MADTAKRDSQEMRYLLGSLLEDERNRLEEGFFADDAKFEELEVLEDELIDAYVSGELSPEQRRQFESQLRKSPRLLERVHFARALAEKVAGLSPEPQAAPGPAVLTSQPIPQPSTTRWWNVFSAPQPAFRMVLAACLVLLLLGGAALLTGWLRLRSESERINSARAALQQKQEEMARELSAQKTRADQLAAELQRAQDQRSEDLKLLEERRAAQSKERTTAAPNIFATIFLSPGQLRGSSANSADLIIRPQNKTARIHLYMENNEYRAYNAVIKYYDSIVFSQRRLRAHVTPSGSQLLLSVPSRLLQANRDYLIHVDGVTTSGQLEDFNDYQFRVIHQPD